jgi:hypothetical protein
VPGPHPVTADVLGGPHQVSCRLLRRRRRVCSFDLVVLRDISVIIALMIFIIASDRSLFARSGGAS